MRYVPKQRMFFTHRGGDGPMALLYDDGVKDRKAYLATWKVCLMTALPASYYASITLIPA